MHTLYFWILATVAIVTSVLVVGQRKPMYSVLLLIASFGALSGLYVLLGSPFVAVIQIIIYAGAIMVLFLFVVMLLNVSSEEFQAGYQTRMLAGSGARRFGAFLSIVLAVQLAWAVAHLQPALFPSPGTRTAFGVYDIGLRLFQYYSFAFEATSVLIIIAMIGAIVLARREQP